MNKKKILFVGEASYLSTGFARYSFEVIRRLHATDKYDIAEFGVYGEMNDRRCAEVPWRFYHNMPRNESEKKTYESCALNQFGEWKFEETALDFMADCCVDWRDHWMFEHQQRSPFRPYFYWSIMPTVDAEPQDEQWLSTFMDANSVHAYSDWGLETLRKQSQGRLRLQCSVPPGADFEAFQPIPKKDVLRKQMGIRPDSLVIGTVMRNQARKLYPDLFKAFAKFLQMAPEDISNKAYLYAHAAYPDVGWDIARLLKENCIGHRVFFTYRCKRCQAIFPSLFQDARCVCKRCHGPYACTPNSMEGIPNKALGLVINLFDVFVQYANSEGFGLPQVEAAACGVPVMSVDYSAMSDVVRKLQGVPIPVKALVRESQTHCYRAVPDEEKFLELLTDFLLQPESLRRRNGIAARKAAEEHYSWDKTARIWEQHFDSIQTLPQTATWLSPPKIHKAQTAVPQGLSNEQFVRWGIVNVAGRPDMVNSYMAARMIRDLNNEVTSDIGMGGYYFNDASSLGSKLTFQPFRREEAMNELMKICGVRNHWESRRAARLKEIK